MRLRCTQANQRLARLVALVVVVSAAVLPSQRPRPAEKDLAGSSRSGISAPKDSKSLRRARASSAKEAARLAAVRARNAEIRAKAMAEYRARAAATPAGDVVRHFALAQFCQAHGLDQAKRWQLHVVLRLAPDHVGARSLRGEVFHDGKWRPAAEAGRVLVDGKWRKSHVADRIIQRREEALRRKHRKNLLLASLSSVDAAARERALTSLRALADATDDGELRRAIARRLAAAPALRGVRRSKASPSFGMIGIAATRTELLGLPTVTTGLAAGVPLRLQLPQTRTISFGTTVLVPLTPGR